MASSPRKSAFAFDSAFSSSQLHNQLEWEAPEEGQSINSLTNNEGEACEGHAPVPQRSCNGGDSTPPPSEENGGSTVRAAVFNFTNAIVGAGAIGLGGAFAASGGAVSVATLLACAALTKVSLDLVLRLSLEQGVASYEELGDRGFGRAGRFAVLSSKLLYSFGCLIAYVIVIKDNLATALLHLIYGEHPDASPSPASDFLRDSDAVTWAVSVLAILPLCLLRDMTPLAFVSLLSVLAMVFIVAIVVYLFLVNPNDQIREKGTTIYEDWVEIRWDGYLQCLGTFVFTFVSQHMVHLAFASLKPELRTLDNWKRVSTCSLGIASTVSLAVGLFAYMTFWEATRSDIFEMYPSMVVIEVAKLLLCLTMFFTFPLPFFTCRELIIVVFVGSRSRNAEPPPSAIDENPAGGLEDGCDLEDPLLPQSANTRLGGDSAEQRNEPSPSGCLLGGNQLWLPLHVLLTVLLWFATTCLAIAAPNLGDCLSVVGCATGVTVAFLLPSLLALRLEGLTATAVILLLVGVVVGVLGTYCSVKKLIQDL